MRSDLLERVHRLALENEVRHEVLGLFGCFSLATVVLRMQKMDSQERRYFEDKIERILERETSVAHAQEEQRI